MNNMKYCPANDFECPYFDANGNCMLDNPAKECDDYTYFCEESD